jgi:hypothetical protein
MGYQGRQSLNERVWGLVRRQHGVVARWQLLELGVHPQAVKHRLAKRRLHPIHRGVYAVGRPDLTQEGHWMAAVLRCGPDAYLSHLPGAAHWRLCRPPPGPIDVSLIAAVSRRAPGIRVHRRPNLPETDLTIHDGIPITTPVAP